MDVLKFLGITLALCALIAIGQIFNTRSKEKFDYFPLAGSAFFLALLTFLIVFAGNLQYQKAMAENGDIWNGIVVMALGTIPYLFLVVKNFKRTDVINGFLISVIQLAFSWHIIGLILWMLFVLAHWTGALRRRKI